MPKIVQAAPTAEPKMSEYLLIAGKHFGRDKNGNEVMYEKGEMVPLTDAQFQAFRDKFEDPEETVRKAEEARKRMEQAKKANNAESKVTLTDEEQKAGWTVKDGKKVPPQQK